jgi:hypothetical protein
MASVLFTTHRAERVATLAGYFWVFGIWACASTLHDPKV